MKVRHYSAADKESAFQLFLTGLSDVQIAKQLTETLSEIYPGLRLSKVTVGQWKMKEDWVARRDNILNLVRQNTDRTSTQEINKAIEIAQKGLDFFSKRLDKGNIPIRPAEAIQFIHLILKLRGASDEQDALFEEVADWCVEALRRSGFTEEQRRVFLRHYMDIARENQE